MNIDFTGIAARYEDLSSVQRSAAEVLLGLLQIGRDDDVLDLGCGVGHLSRKIRELTNGRIVGVDPAEGMIREAVEKGEGLDITFEVKSAEELDYKDCFDVIFCNSALQWFSDPERAIENCYIALRRGGRIGVQAPAKKVYNPNFVEAVGRVREDPRTKDIFSHFRNPWFLLEKMEEYEELFEKHNLRVVFSKMEKVETRHTPEEVFNIFSSGAVAGYLNQDHYDVELNADYVAAFNEIVGDAFLRQANSHGEVAMVFNRIFLVAIKDKTIPIRR